jgi:hypothetical protein
MAEITKLNPPKIDGAKWKVLTDGFRATFPEAITFILAAADKDGGAQVNISGEITPIADLVGQIGQTITKRIQSQKPAAVPSLLEAAQDLLRNFKAMDDAGDRAGLTRLMLQLARATQS